jgi:lipoprotein-releasing system permease protein
VQQECLTLQDQMPSLFEWLNFFDTNRLVLLILLASVGAVNLISALFILLLERQNSLGILQSLGLRSGPLALVVWQLGMRMVLKGWLLGNLGLGILMFTQIRYRWFGLDPGSYYLDAVPLRLAWSEWALVNGWALAATAILLYLAAFFFAQRTVDRNIKFS